MTTDHPQPGARDEELEPLIRYVARYGGKCRDCADEDGICPRNGLPCGKAREAIAHVLKALKYGAAHGYADLAPILPTPSTRTWGV
jgi:hypothetical protein